MWDSLEAARSNGDAFRADLEQQDGFSMTKWFDKVSGPVKGVCLVVALAGGLTGCNTMQFAGNYTNLQQEARMIDSMAATEMAGFIQERGVEAPDAATPKVTVNDFAKAVEQAQKYPFDGPVQIENPFVEGQYFKVFNGKNLSDHVELAIEQGASALNWTASAGGSTYLVNPDHPNATTRFGMDSFHDHDHSSAIVYGDHFFHNWDPGSRTAENASFVVYHELAHGHVTQEAARFGMSESFIDAMDNANINTFNETHADVTASIMVYKHSDLEPSTFLDRLDNLRAYSDKSMIDKANGDGTSDHWYRPQQSIEVLNEIVKQDPEFLKSLPDSHVPIFAYEVVKEAGFDHNTASVLMNKYADIGNDVRPSADQDALFLQDVRASYDDAQLKAQGERLEAIWGQMQTNAYIDFYKDGLNKVLTDRVNEIPEQHLESLGDKLGDAGKTYSGVSDLIERHIDIVQSDADPRLIKHQLKEIARDLQDLSKQYPSNDNLKAERSDLIQSMQERITELGEHQMEKDMYSKLAHGQSPDTNPAEIANQMIRSYTINGIDITPKQPFAEIDTSQAKISFNQKLQQYMDRDHQGHNHDR